MLPSKVNGHKKNIIKIVDDKFDGSNFDPLLKERRFIEDYFGLVALNIQANAKKDFLDQTRSLKGWLSFWIVPDHGCCCDEGRIRLRL